MRPSAFAPCGLLRFGGGVSIAEKIYRAQVAQLTDPKTGRSPFDLTPGTYQESRLFARSIALGLALAALERAGNQRDPRKAEESLAELEDDFHITPNPKDSLPVRQARVTAKKKGHAGGALTWSVVDALRTLLGAAFLSYFPSPTKTAYTAGPKNGQPTARPAKFVVLTEPVAPTTPGAAREVGYANLDPAQDEMVLSVGDVVMVQPDCSAVAEKLTVTATGGTAGARTAMLAFQKAHHAGAVVTNMHWPFEPTYSRQNFVVLTAAAAADPKTRALVDDLMPDITRTVSTWAIVAGSGGAIGHFALGSSPLGTAPLSDMTYTASP